MRKHLILAGLSVVLASTPVLAKVHPFDRDFEAKVASLFLVNGQVSTAKVDAYLSRLQLKRHEIGTILEAKLKSEGEKIDKIEEKIESDKMTVALTLAEQDLRRMRSTRDLGETMELAFHALDLENSVRIEGKLPPIMYFRNSATAFLGTWEIRKDLPASDEASNLWNPKTGSYLSESEITEIKKSHGDLSTYGPRKSLFWQDPGTISNVDVKKAARGETLNLYRDVAIEFPADHTYRYDKVRYSDTKPKIDAYVETADGKKQKFKLKFGGELHSDPTLSALMMSLGFPSDVTQYQRGIKLVIGKTPLSDLKRDWELYYTRDAIRSDAGSSFKIEEVIQETGVDANGDRFVIFKEGMIEAKPKEIERVGPWTFGDNGVSSLREVRGLMMVQLWLENNDVKEGDNNRVLLKRNPNGEIETYNIISDVGHALSTIYLERPDLYKMKMVTRNDAHSLALSYRSTHVAKIKNKISYDDGRWATRLIAGLTRKQIEDAVSLGSWPACVRDIYIEKVIARRNDLVKNFDLPAALIPLGKTPEQLEFKNVCNQKQLQADYTSDFQFDLGLLFKPFGIGIARKLADGARSVVNSNNRIVLKSDKFDGFDTKLVSEVILGSRRDIERNESPTSEADLYLVKDQFEVGLRLGVAYGVYKDVVYTRSFTLAYPARTVSEARLNNGFIVNVLLAKDIREGDLPAKYVLKTEHHLESGAGLDFEQYMNPVSPGVKLGHSKIQLMRSILDHKDAKRVVLYRDRPSYAQNFLQAFLRIGFLKIPFFTTLANWGESSGMGVVLPAERLISDSTLDKKLTDAAVSGDFTAFKAEETRFNMQNKFDGSSSGWNFLIASSAKENRLDRITLISDGTEREAIQYQTSNDKALWVIQSKEQKNVRVEAFVDPRAENETFQLRVKVLGVDLDTKTGEMENGYVAFVNGLSTNENRLISLTPSLGYTSNGRWGEIVTQSDTIYYHEALGRILTATPEEFRQALAATEHAMPLANDQDRANLASNGEKFLKKIAEAKAAPSLEVKVRKLAEAFRGAAYRTSGGFLEPRILGAVNRIVTTQNLYSYNVITVPQFKELNLIAETPLIGVMGKQRAENFSYLTYVPTTPSDLYFMLDNWF